MKRISFALIILMALPLTSIAFAQEKCTVSGEVVYSGDANIYVCLLTSETFPAAMGRQSDLPPPGFVHIIKATASGKGYFAFNDVPKGEYLIQAFADENNNAKMDKDWQGYAIEPRDYYKPRPDLGMYTNWNEQKFKVGGDLTGIVLKLR